jgi:uncharacterized glyoxalase superfamily protein PhnB
MNEPNTVALRAQSLEAALTVNDLNASVDWYSRVLGCTIHQKHERQTKLIAVSLRAGDVAILLVHDDGAKGVNRTKGEGISLQFTTIENIDALADRARSAGVSLDTEPVNGPAGQRIFRLRDPDGFRITISSPRVS